MDVERVKAEIRRLIGERNCALRWAKMAELAALLEWIEAQQAAEIRAADGFQGTTLTSAELIAKYGEADRDPRTGVEYGDMD